MPTRILLVDDEPAILRAYARLLSREGFDVETAGTGPAALDRLRNTQFDALVTDVLMPGMSGSDLVDQMRAHQPLLPVVVMTASPNVQSAVRAINSGATAYLTKPVEALQLVDAVKRAIQIAPRGERVASMSPPPAQLKSMRDEIERSVLAFQPVI